MPCRLRYVAHWLRQKTWNGKNKIFNTLANKYFNILLSNLNGTVGYFKC